MCNSFDVWYILIFLHTEAYDTGTKAHIHGDFVCLWSSCEHTFEILRPRGVSKRTTNLSTVSGNMSPVASSITASIPFVTPEQCAGWCGADDLWSSPMGNNRCDSYSVKFVARTSRTRSAVEIDSIGHGLPNKSCRTSQMTSTVYRSTPSCFKNVVFTWPALGRPGMTSFCSCCRPFTFPHPVVPPSYFFH
jgi:hypothetical protein